MRSEIECSALEIRVREIVGRYGRLGKPVAQISDDSSLAEAGMSSLASVDVMLALEAEFGEFPECMLNGKVFFSIESITNALHELRRP